MTAPAADDGPDARPDDEAVSDATEADWAELGLEPGADARALKAAYARKLKTVKPDVDPEGFKRLRAAFDRLKTAAADPVAATPEPTPATPWGSIAEGEATACADLVYRFDARRRRADVEGALALIDESLTGSLQIGWRHRLEDGLFDSVARDPSAGRALLQALATRFDWREATTRQEGRDAEAMAELRGRVEAADFADGLRARAEAARAGEGPPGDRVLVRLLGPYRVGLFDKALDADERGVAGDVMNAVFDHLADLDDVIDTRTIAALRGTLGAAPLAMALPHDVTRETTATETDGHLDSASASRSWSVPGAIWVVIVLLGLVNGMRTDWGHQTPRNSGRTEYSPRTPDYRTDRPSPIEMSFPIKQRDGRLGLDLSPLLEAKVRSQLYGVRFEDRSDGSKRTVAIDDLAANPVHDLPAGESIVTLALVFLNGDTTKLYRFDLNERVPPPAASNEAKTADGPRVTPDAPAKSNRPENKIRFAPSLAETDGHVFINLSSALTEDNLKSLQAIRLQMAPEREPEVLDVAALKIEPRREVPNGSERVTMRLLYTNGGESRDFVYELKDILARMRSRATQDERGPAETSTE